VIAAIKRHADTEAGDVKRLKGRRDVWRLRVGDWRVFMTYRFGDRVIEIARAMHRSEAYD
jgi:mRNA-degrading endonuclease RelE of RelBE toxin-antitoxin system